MNVTPNVHIFPNSQSLRDWAKSNMLPVVKPSTLGQGKRFRVKTAGIMRRIRKLGPEDAWGDSARRWTAKRARRYKRHIRQSWKFYDDYLRRGGHK